MKKLSLSVVATVLFTFIMMAGNNGTDSLKQVINTTSDSVAKVNAMNALGWKILNVGRYKEADSITRNAMAMARRIKHQKGIGVSYNNLGVIAWNKGNYPEGLHYIMQALKIWEQTNSKKNEGGALGNIGLIYKEEGNYPKALEYDLKSLKLRQKIKDKHGASYADGNIGIVYFEEKNYPKALGYCFDALKIDTVLGDKNATAFMYNVIGLVYWKQKKYEKSLAAYHKSEELFNNLKNEQGLVNVYSNIGALCFDQGKYKDALKYFQSTYVKRQELGDQNGMTTSLANMGEVYRKQKNYKAALEKENKALALAKKIGAYSKIKDAERSLSMIYEKLGKEGKALDHYKAYVAARDTLYSEANDRKMLQAQMNYDFGQKEAKLKANEEKQTLLNEEELKRQKLLTWVAAGVLLLLLILSWLLFNASRLRQKNSYQKELNRKQKEQAMAVMGTQERERKRIAEDLHDSLGQLLSTVKLSLQSSVQNEKPDFEQPLVLLNQASSELRDITFNLMPRTLEEYGLIPALQELAGRINNADAVKVSLQVHSAEKLLLDKQVEFTIYRVIQEAVNNALKYAEAKEISIQLLQQDNTLAVMIEDNGKGFEMNHVKNGRGLKNMTSRTAWLDGQIAVDSSPEHGTTVSIQIPL